MSGCPNGTSEIGAGEPVPALLLNTLDSPQQTNRLEIQTDTPQIQEQLPAQSPPEATPHPLPEIPERRPSRLKKTLVALGSVVSLLLGDISEPTTTRSETNTVIIDDVAAERHESLSRRFERMLDRTPEISTETTVEAKKEISLTAEQQTLIDSFRISEGQKKFFSEMVLAMMAVGPYETNRYVKLAQIWQEMGMLPDGELETTHHNILGIKYFGNPGDKSTGPIWTTEYINGRRVSLQDEFISFPSYAACLARGINDMKRLEHFHDTLPHYDRPEDTKEQAFERMELFIFGLQNPEGLAYATDPNYGKSLMFLITKFIYPVMSLEPKPDRVPFMNSTEAIGQEFDHPSDYEPQQQLAYK